MTSPSPLDSLDLAAHDALVERLNDAGAKSFIDAYDKGEESLLGWHIEGDVLTCKHEDGKAFYGVVTKAKWKLVPLTTGAKVDD